MLFCGTFLAKFRSKACKCRKNVVSLQHHSGKKSSLPSASRTNAISLLHPRHQPAAPKASASRNHSISQPTPLPPPSSLHNISQMVELPLPSVCVLLPSVCASTSRCFCFRCQLHLPFRPVPTTFSSSRNRH